ncbi:hypothetical protein C8J56DRAFT_934649 [Mycena floridula]|nr:hypothetical protein C8J56DRAFT_934649 [Mycena floridula]
MSRCPDALVCEAVFDKVLQKASNKMELSFLYVASIDPSDPEYGVSCKHGPLECAGNIQQLCVAEHEPFNTLWDFVMCQDQNKDSIGRIERAVECAEIAGFNWTQSQAGNCASSSGEGLQLLKDNIKRARAMEIEKSCTILINGRKVCIHDSSWKDCPDGHSVESFVERIEKEYEQIERPFHGILQEYDLNSLN